MDARTPNVSSPPCRLRQQGGEEGFFLVALLLACQTDSPTAQGRWGLELECKVALSTNQEENVAYTLHFGAEPYTGGGVGRIPNSDIRRSATFM